MSRAAVRSTRPPRNSTIAAVSVNGSAWMSVRTTDPPRAATSSAVARPMPPAAPVIRHLRPARSIALPLVLVALDAQRVDRAGDHLVVADEHAQLNQVAVAQLPAQGGERLVADAAVAVQVVDRRQDRGLARRPVGGVDLVARDRVGLGGAQPGL